MKTIDDDDVSPLRAWTLLDRSDRQRVYEVLLDARVAMNNRRRACATFAATGIEHDAEVEMNALAIAFMVLRDADHNALIEREGDRERKHDRDCCPWCGVSKWAYAERDGGRFMDACQCGHSVWVHVDKDIVTVRPAWSTERVFG